MIISMEELIILLHMKKSLIFVVTALFAISAVAQEKKPTLMIVPSDNWCAQRYFVSTYQDQGQTIHVPDYKLAFQEDTELGGVLSKIGAMLTDKGYSLKDCEQEIKSIAIRTAEDNVTMSKLSGAMLAESPLDVLKRRAKSDIIIQLGWQIHVEPKGKSATFILEAFDAYTNKRIATASGTSKASKDIVPRILESAVREHIDDFDKQLIRYFRDLQTNGREIILSVRCWDNWDEDLESEYNGEELLDCLQAWLRDNTVKGVFNLSDATENFAQFEQVRIPLTDDKGVAMDARAFATTLRKYLQSAPFGITSKVMVRGLGEAVVVLGEK